MATTKEIEQEEQRRWKPLPEWSAVKWHDGLVTREFVTQEQEEALEANAIHAVARFVAEQVPYYQDLFKRLGISADDIRRPEDLLKLPVLTRSDVQEHKASLCARTLPEGQRVASMVKTSGSTGQPVEVYHSSRSAMMFPILKQRQMRWARIDPMGRIGMIRPPKDLPRGPEGRLLEEGETCERDTWSVQVGPYFQTGRLVGFSNRNDVDRQVDWVEEQRLDYLLGHAAELEHLAFGFQDRQPPEGLRGIFAIAQQLAPEMRQRIERTFSLDVQENYGFNEIGIVATRCVEGGRYHVNAEHCLVEIVDDDGYPCAPGERGHVVTTTLVNAAMPLIRYDSGDLAEAVGGPCPCGRSLPAFGDIHGRYRRLLDLPSDTFRYWNALRTALGDLPENLSKPLRQYQLHQYRDGSYELRIVIAGTFPAAFSERVQAVWAAAASDPPSLVIRVVDEIPRPPGGKFQDFTSDFSPT